MVSDKEYEAAIAELRAIWDQLDNYVYGSPEHTYYNKLIDIVLDWEEQNDEI